jgi:hypothetical protein
MTTKKSLCIYFARIKSGDFLGGNTAEEDIANRMVGFNIGPE